MTAISFQEAAIRSELPLGKIKELAAGGYFKTVHNPFSTMIDADSFDQYLANEEPPKVEQKEVIVKKEELKLMSETASTPNGKSVDKIKRYGWKVNGTRGFPMDIPKRELKIDYSYQRPQTRSKVLQIQSDFRWPAFGRVLVSLRENGEYYIFDGGHRWTATLSRSDINLIPCEVFQFDSIETEAQAYRDANINRKPMGIIYRYKAGIIANDKDTVYISVILKRHNIRVMQSLESPLSFKSIGSCYSMVKDSPEAFEKAVSLAAELCANSPIYGQVLEGLFYLAKNVKGGIENPTFKNKVLKIGPNSLLQAAQEAIRYHQKSGAKVWASGMLKLINKGRGEKHQFEFQGGAA